MKRHFALLLLLGIVGLTSGCAGMPKGWAATMPWAEKPSQISESKYQSPVKMVAIWSPAMYNAAGKTPTRGFGGRLYFYNSKNETIPVQGQLVVYCFDDTKKSNDHKQADRRVAFTPEQFSSHFSPTELVLPIVYGFLGTLSAVRKPKSAWYPSSLPRPVRLLWGNSLWHCFRVPRPRFKRNGSTCKSSPPRPLKTGT